MVPLLKSFSRDNDHRTPALWITSVARRSEVMA